MWIIGLSLYLLIGVVFAFLWYDHDNHPCSLPPEYWWEDCFLFLFRTVFWFGIVIVRVSSCIISELVQSEG